MAQFYGARTPGPWEGFCWVEFLFARTLFRHRKETWEPQFFKGRTILFFLLSRRFVGLFVKPTEIAEMFDEGIMLLSPRNDQLNRFGIVHVTTRPTPEGHAQGPLKMLGNPPLIEISTTVHLEVLNILLVSHCIETSDFVSKRENHGVMVSITIQ